MEIWEAVRGLVIAVGGFALVFGAWIGVQTIVRRYACGGPDHDPLSGHGCAGCKNSGACRRARSEKHELA